MHPVLKIMHMLNFLDTFSMGIILMLYILMEKCRISKDLLCCVGDFNAIRLVEERCGAVLSRLSGVVKEEL
jgi:hypothetical protein